VVLSTADKHLVLKRPETPFACNYMIPRSLLV